MKGKRPLSSFFLKEIEHLPLELVALAPPTEKIIFVTENHSLKVGVPEPCSWERSSLFSEERGKTWGFFPVPMERKKKKDHHQSTWFFSSSSKKK
jgi:hypothetical protein